MTGALRIEGILRDDSRGERDDAQLIAAFTVANQAAGVESAAPTSRGNRPETIGMARAIISRPSRLATRD